MPEIIAHRGAPREALENTLESFQIALEQGADGIELDVHATRDGVVVVHHDASAYVTRDSGPEQALALASVNASDLLTCRLKGGVQLPTLDAVLHLVGGRATVYIEVKAPGIEGPLVSCLDRHPTARVAVHAFDHRIPVAIRLARPKIPIGLLSTSYPINLRGFVGAAQPQAFWQQASLIDQALVDAAHELGARVVAWTENDAVHARSLIAMGVDALCTDIAGPLRAALVP